MFQSSPDPKAGCNGEARGHRRTPLSFQSSPDPKAGCNYPSAGRSPSPAPVSILTRPEGRMQPRDPYVHGATDRLVSILTRPGRPDATVGSHAGRISRIRGFNPHPTRRPDATPASEQQYTADGSFNPHPTRRPDATTWSPRETSAATCFNPHPTRRPDANVGCSQPSKPPSRLFQSSPDPKGRMQQSASHSGP